MALGDVDDASTSVGQGGYGAVSARQASSQLSGRRAAVCIGALLAACVFLALSNDSAKQLPAVLFGGDWGGSFTATAPPPAPYSAPAITFHLPVYSSVAEAKTASSIEATQAALDKTLASRMGEDASIGSGEGISGRWSSFTAPAPVLPSTGEAHRAQFC